MSDDVKYVMELDVEGSPKGEPFQIAGLGTFENGKTYEITKDEADAYRTYNTRQVPRVDEETNAILGADIEPGPTLLQASKTMNGVTVTTADSNDKSDEEPQTEGPSQVAEPEPVNEEGGES